MNYLGRVMYEVNSEVPHLQQHMSVSQRASAEQLRERYAAYSFLCWHVSSLQPLAATVYSAL